MAGFPYFPFRIIFILWFEPDIKRSGVRLRVWGGTPLKMFGRPKEISEIFLSFLGPSKLNAPLKWLILRNLKTLITKVL